MLYLRYLTETEGQEWFYFKTLIKLFGCFENKHDAQMFVLLTHLWLYMKHVDECRTAWHNSQNKPHLYRLLPTCLPMMRQSMAVISCLNRDNVSTEAKQSIVQRLYRLTDQ